jgi:hypothetical protein
LFTIKVNFKRQQQTIARRLPQAKRVRKERKDFSYEMVGWGESNFLPMKSMPSPLWLGDAATYSKSNRKACGECRALN